MPKLAKALSPLEVLRLTRPGRYAVGEVVGLHLIVRPTGSRQWLLRTTVAGKRVDMGLGGFPSVTIKQARERARDALDAIYKGADPVCERKARQEAIRADRERQKSFAWCMDQFLAAKTIEFRNPKHAAQWRSTLEAYAVPMIGSRNVRSITVADLLSVLNQDQDGKSFWLAKNETASRVRGRIEKVLDWAIVGGFRDGPNPARWVGNLDIKLPKPGKVQKVENHAAMPRESVPAFVDNLRKHPGTAARALEFTILTAARSGEVRGATWAEFDLAARTWTIPGERIKAGRAHVVPLNAPAVALLKAQPQIEGEPYAFPSPKGGPLSENGMLAVLSRMGESVTAHGFRSAFKDWARAEQGTAFADEVSELCLAHVNNDATRAAYARDGLLDLRRDLMQRWADYVRSNRKRRGKK